MTEVNITTADELSHPGEMGFLLDKLTEAAPGPGEELTSEQVSLLRERARAIYDSFYKYEEDEIGECLTALNNIDEATGGALKSWRALSYIPKLVKDEVRIFNEATIDEMLQRGAYTKSVENGNELADYLRAADDMLEPQYGSPTRWREYTSEWDNDLRAYKPKKIFSGPEYMRHLIESKNFVPACIDMACEQAREEFNHKKRDQTLNHLQDDIIQRMMDELVHHSLAFDFMASFQVRAMERENGKTISYEDGGGYDLEYWRERMQRFVYNVESIGAKNAVRLREEFGISNFDRYTVEQLGRMIKVLDKDPQMLERLRKGNLTVVAIDGLGDHNGASDDRISTYDKTSAEDDIVLFYEVNEPEDLYGGMEKIHELTDAQASVMVWAAHGGKRGMHFNAGNARFTFDKYEFDNPLFGMFVDKYMRPHSVTRKKIFILSSCSQAKRPDDEPYHPDLTETHSTLEVLARSTDPEDEVLFFGLDQPAAITANKDGVLRMSLGGKPRKYAPFTCIQHTKAGIVVSYNDTILINPKEKVA